MRHGRILAAMQYKRREAAEVAHISHGYAPVNCGCTLIVQRNKRRLNLQQKEHCMKRDRSNPGLEAIYARLDEIHMSPADRLNARAALAQADALADFFLGTIDLAKRLFRTRVLRPTSAHG
jgi:hypothetical protein